MNPDTIRPTISGAHFVQSPSISFSIISEQTGKTLVTAAQNQNYCSLSLRFQASDWERVHLEQRERPDPVSSRQYSARSRITFTLAPGSDIGLWQLDKSILQYNNNNNDNNNNNNNNSNNYTVCTQFKVPGWIKNEYGNDSISTTELTICVSFGWKLGLDCGLHRTAAECLMVVLKITTYH